MNVETVTPEETTVPPADAEAPERLSVQVEEGRELVRQKTAEALGLLQRALGDVREQIDKLPEGSPNRRALLRRLKELELMQRSIGTPDGPIELSYALAHQPTAHQLSMTGRPKVLLERVERRLKRLTISLPELRHFVAAVYLLDPDNAVEICHRFLHFLDKAPLQVYAVTLGRSMRRVVAAGQLIVRAEPSDAPPLKDEEQEIVRTTKEGIAGFLAAARK